MTNEPFDWRLQACRIAAAFEVSRVYTDQWEATFVFDRYDDTRNNNLSRSFDRSVPAYLLRPDVHERYEVFLVNTATVSWETLWNGVGKCRLWKNSKEKMRFCIGALRLLGFEIDDFERGHAQWYGWTLPLWTYHELLEAQLGFDERLQHHLQVNGLELQPA